ncbi:type II toxin-antitoxin system RelE/ParE family toxin [Streptomyces sp. Li-HN-5-11]|uniref:type II toxin-antitoxin system RelE family toxin n=1 Tax=Streptomyces sp. Li-HN-5-11 TaxID=3075432 RepID=UPI0028AE54F8|nr:type II toxin-antitoxin system RelE/ParE family toxin [Streptomyces sp. Li-HN-5-11]WNM29818.1 type II toxin-antitoxin system RelE/ParE family toxin [Streptomyces sp. Li-HN-5-11]
MTYEIVFEPQALDAAERFLKGNPSALAQVLDTVDKLAHEPRPTGSIVYGSPDLRRLHTGGYRVLYIVEDDVARILVTHVSRTP